MSKLKKTISTLLTIIMVCTATIGSNFIVAKAAASNEFNKTINTSSFSVGDIVYYSFSLGSINEEVAAANIHLTFDENVLSYVEGTCKDPNNLGLIANGPPSSGKIYLNFGHANGIDFSTKKTVFTVRFRVNSAATTTIKATVVEMFDNNFNMIDPTDKVTISAGWDYIVGLEIAGKLVVEQTLTANVYHTGDGQADVCYKWQRSSDKKTWTTVSTEQTYTLTASDVNQYVRVVVTSKGTNVSPATVTRDNNLKVLQLGDVDKDGRVSMSDVLLVQRHIAAIIKLDSRQVLAADVDRNGVVDMADVLLIQKYIAKLITEF